MAGPGVFHVEFGINDTQLTRALERQDYDKAESLVRENNSETYLDEGCYQRTPLYIVLCGTDEERDHPKPRNLLMAKRLIEYGANVNYRIPTTYFGSEYMDPGKTALELVVDLFDQLTLHECHLSSQTDCGTSELSGVCWNPCEQPVLGLDGDPITDLPTLLENLLDLTFIMLSHGGDTNVGDEFRMTPLHRTAVFSRDPRMLRLLCEHGADVNAVDLRGNTPLMVMCDAFPTGIQGFLDNNPFGNPYQEGCHVEGKDEFVQYLTSFKDTQLDVQNKLGRTALFHCMMRGDVQSASVLLRAGCDVTLKGQIRGHGHQTREISPLFVAMSSLKVVRSPWDRYHCPVWTSPANPLQFLTHIVDSGLFSKSSVTSEIFDFIDHDYPHMQHLKMFGTELIHLMFGATTASLRQLTTRKIFHQLMTSCSGDFGSLIDEAEQVNWNRTVVGGSGCENISTDDLESLIDKAHLPQDGMVYFEIELLRYRLCSKLSRMQWFKYYDENIDGLYRADSDTEEYSSDENDSDLEYW